MKLIALFIEMQEQYLKWIAAIEQLDSVNDAQKESYKKIVAALSKSSAPVILNVRHFALLVGIDYNALKRMFYARDKFYRSFSIRKRSGGSRCIEAPYPSLKRVQRWILDNILLPTAIVHPSAVGFLPQKSIVDNARPHLGQPFLLKMDIKDFFPSITEAMVIRYFRNLGYDLSLSDTLAYLCCKDKRLPQGAPTSPLLSNVLFSDMDADLSRMAIEEDIRYTRYADDLSFSGTRIPIRVIGRVVDITGRYRLRINSEKTRRSGSKSRKIITGVSISCGKVTIPREIKREIRKKVYYVLKFGLYDHLKHIQSRDVLAGYRLLGLLAYWHSIEPGNQYVIDSSSKLIRALHSQQKTIM